MSAASLLVEKHESGFLVEKAECGKFAEWDVVYNFLLPQFDLEGGI